MFCCGYWLVALAMDILKDGVRLRVWLEGTFFRLRVTSRKLSICLLASIVMRRPLLVKI